MFTLSVTSGVDYRSSDCSNDPGSLCCFLENTGNHLPIGPLVCPGGNERALLLYFGCHLTENGVLRIRITLEADFDGYENAIIP